MKPTRIEKTEKEYLKCAGSIISRYIKESGQTIENVESLIDWLLNTLQPSIVKSTWRHYRASIVFYLHYHNHIPEAVTSVKKIDNQNCKKESVLTSALKQKKLSEQDVDLISSKLNAVKNKWDGLLQCWLDASLLTGMRPAEWETALLRGDFLIVQNAKNTNGRCFGEVRDLNLSNLDVHSYEAIEKFLQLLQRALQENDGNFEHIYTACRQRLRGLTVRLWSPKKKHPTLYSSRHQFAADMKNTLSRKEIATLMGHGTDATVTEHYGKKRYGTHKENHILPDPNQVDLVRETGIEVKKRVKINKINLNFR